MARLRELWLRASCMLRSDWVLFETTRPGDHRARSRVRGGERGGDGDAGGVAQKRARDQLPDRRCGWTMRSAARGAFTDGTVTRLENAFYRSKLTGWMAQQEENYRFILLQADASDGAWSRVCVSQADRVAVVAKTSHRGASSGAFSGSSSVSKKTTTRWILRPHSPSGVCCGAGGAEPPWSSCSCTRPGAAPAETRQWRASRAPRCGGTTCCAFRPTRTSSGWRGDVAGRAVGVVLTGGGGHGLAHL